MPPSPLDPLRDLATLMSIDLQDIERTHMPFGKFGPKSFPPSGVPIFDLPVEYLGWFARTSWPTGRLGELLRIVYQMKVDGADVAFDPMRQRAGGKRSLRPPRKPAHFHFEG